MDDFYQAYFERLGAMVQPRNYAFTLQYLQKSPKFSQTPDGKTIAAPFPGYTFMSRPQAEDPANGAAYTQLQSLYQQMAAAFPSDMLVALPLASYHMTIADLIWDSAYRDRCRHASYDDQLRHRLADVFAQVESQVMGPAPVTWQVLGCMIMPRAIGVCLVPRCEASYSRTLEVRRAVYQDAGLMGLGIDQQYHFTAHVTLAYVADVPSSLDREAIAHHLQTLNTTLAQTPIALDLDRAELRHFTDMTTYTRTADWPVLHWVTPPS
jgi:hypothetical protein